ncbi:MAG: ATP-binding protein [Simkaniaceae bacterium]
MYKRFFTPPKGSYFLFGPRGTGKSTWLKMHCPQALWIDLLDPETFRFLSTGPERLQGMIESNPSCLQIVIDEIQKIPELLDVVHSLIEAKKNYQFILTGSSARKLKKYGVNLLGGRALLRHMPPFFAAELGNNFQLEKNLKVGMLPIVLDAVDPEEVLRAYVGIYLKEEVQAEGIVRNVGNFARFLETMSFSHGSIINTSNISRECQIARKTLDSYLQILEDLLLSFHLSIFRRKSKRDLVSQEKFYFFDVGVYLSMRPKNLYDIPSEIEGAALEGLVAQHLKGWVEAQKEKHQLHYWRTRSKLEVDFIVSGPKTFLAIEVKNGKAVHPKDLHGLQAFIDDYPEATPLLLYRGKQTYKEGKVSCIPIETFLKMIHPENPLL